MPLHIHLGSEILRPDIRQQVLALAALDPGGSFSINITGAEIVSLIGNPQLATYVAAVKSQEAPASVTATVATSAPAAAPVAPVAPAAEATEGKRIRRTKAETEAGLSVEEAEAFRASGQSDPKAWKAAQAGGDVGDTGVKTPEPTAPEAPAAAPTTVADAPVVITEADVRKAAVTAVQGNKREGVLAIAKKYGVADWKQLKEEQLKAVFDELTSLLVVA